MTFMLVVTGLLFSNAAQGATRVIGISVGAQPTAATYGTAVTITYTITLAKMGTNNGTDDISISWAAGAAPNGVTTSFPFGSPYNPRPRTTVTVSIVTTAATPAGSYDFTITNVDGNGGGTKTSNGTLLIGQKTLTITGLTAPNKTYDGTTSETLTGTAALSGVVGGDDVALGGTPSAVFASKNVGTNIAITVSGYTLSGADAGNYTLTQPTGLKANITTLALTITGLTANDKVYNGNTTASFTGGTLVGVIGGDVVNLVPSGTFASKHVANGIAVTSTSTLTGANAGNYTITQPGGLTADITPKALSIAASTANKTYGNTLTSGSVTTGFSAPLLVAGDAIPSLTMTYGTGAAATDNVGTYTGSAVPSAAANGANFTATDYTITYNAGDIVCGAAALNIKASNQTKTYGTSFTFAGTEFTATGLKNSDAATSASIASAGAVSTASVAGGPYPITISGANGTGLSNYTITYTDGTMTVTGVAITITATGPTTRYYGQPITTLTGSSLFTVIGTLATGQSVTTVTLMGDGNAQFDYTNAGTNYTITPSSAAGTGGFSASNYNITYVPYTGTVSPAPITITATGPTTKVYGQALTTTTVVNNTTNFTETGTMPPFEQIRGVTLTPSGPGVAANAPAGSSYTITPSAAQDYIFFLFGYLPYTTSNYDITYVGFTTGSVTPAPLTITANAVSKTVGVALTGGTGSTAFTSSGLANSETIGSVTIAYGAAAAAGAAVGTYTNQVTPSAATGGTFSAGNYTITYTSNTLTVVGGIYDWTGAVSADWATPQNWSISGVQQTATYPGLNIATDVVRIGVAAFNSANQPIVAATLPNSITSLTFGSVTSPITLGLNTSVALTVTGTTTLNAGSEIVNLNGASGSSLNIGGDYVTGTGSTFNNNSSAAITITGLFTNSGTSNFGTALLTFNNPNNPNTFTTAGVQLFTNVLFSNGHYLLKGPGQYNVASTGTLSLSGGVTLTVANGPLTLLSDANGSGTLANVPAGCQINGTVSVQRYLTGQRGYRLLASPVNAVSNVADANGNLPYSLNYVKNSAYITGSASGGFDKTGNPTLYLYREDVPVNNSTFISGNYRGISNILTAPTYSLNNEGSTYTIPVSNGFLFFFRGNKADGTLAQETTTSWLATAATLTASGSPNIGQVVFRDWYTPSSNILGFSNADIAAQGFNLAGNPYASSIDLDTYNTTTATSGIYAQNLSQFIYELNPVTQNYDTYKAGSATAGTIVNTNHGGRTIVSGQGFFVLALNTGPAQLIFNESAKVSTQVPVNTGNNPNPALMMAARFAKDQHLRLQLAKDSINTDDILLRFAPNSKNTFDITEDAPYKPGAGKVSLSSFSADHMSLAINHLPFAVKGQRIPLKVGATTDGTYSLNLTELKGIPQLFNVWLKDNFLKDSVNMRTSSSYSFSILHSDTNTYGANRFVLVINQNPDLAYRLLSFNASKDLNERAVQVAWKTQYEDNYTQFIVEKSIDNGKTFNVLGSVGSVNLGMYSLPDSRPIVGQNLYRLKQIDINNNVTYSKVVLVAYSNLSNSIAKNNVSLFPNPATSDVNLAILTDKTSQTYDIKIINNLGLVVKQVTSNQPNWQLNVSDWLPGTYQVKVFNSKDQTEVGTTKLIKL